MLTTLTACTNQQKFLETIYHSYRGNLNVIRGLDLLDSLLVWQSRNAVPFDLLLMGVQVEAVIKHVLVTVYVFKDNVRAMLDLPALIAPIDVLQTVKACLAVGMAIVKHTVVNAMKVGEV